MKLLSRFHLPALLTLCLCASAPGGGVAGAAGQARPTGNTAAAHLSEAAGWLRAYLRIDTTTPPGNERSAAVYLGGILQRAGIPSRLVATPSGRASLWARLAAAGHPPARPAILLLHHLDVVAPGPGWSVQPFGGVVRDGRLWGRGAIDDKSLGIAQLAALIDLKRRGVALDRDVIFLAVADEESGGGQGTGWLLEHHPELFAGVEAVIGEGGRNQIGAGDRLLWWGVEVAQKRPLWLEVKASGRGGHGSGLNPFSAIHVLIAGLDRVLQAKPRWHVTPAARDYLAAIAPMHGEKLRHSLSHLDETIGPDGPRGLLMPGMANLFLDTVQVTVLNGGSRINVIPESARALVDVRLLPDTDSDEFLKRMNTALGQGVEARVLLSSPPAPSSPASGRLYAALARVLAKEAPVVPAMIPGLTDSRYFRQRGIAAYGVSPFVLKAEDLAGIHGRDERIPLAELDRGVERMRRLLTAYAGARPGTVR